MRVITGGKRRPLGRRNKKKIVMIVLLGIIVLVTIAFLYVLNAYRVKEVAVEGNVHYTDEEIRNMVMKGMFGNNSLYLSMKYKDKEVVDIPFVDMLDVTVVSPKKIKIRVYEKLQIHYIYILFTACYDSLRKRGSGDHRVRFCRV